MEETTKSKSFFMFRSEPTGCDHCLLLAIGSEGEDKVPRALKVNPDLGKVVFDPKDPETRYLR